MLPQGTRGDVQLSDSMVEGLGQFDAIADDALHLLTEALNGRRRPGTVSLQSE